MSMGYSVGFLTLVDHLATEQTKKRERTLADDLAQCIVPNNSNFGRRQLLSEFIVSICKLGFLVLRN